MNTQPDQCRTAESACGRQCLDLEGHDGDHAYERARTVPQLADIPPAAFGVSSEEAAANVTANVPVLAAAGLPAAEPSTDGTEAAEDTARRFARRLAAVEQLCSGRPGYHTVTVKALLTAMGEADEEGQEQPPGALLDPFTEAAIRHSALTGGALAIEALPQDHECDPGRGDAVKLLLRLASLAMTTEQPAGLTWEARAEHAVRLYATTAIELEDARRENTQLRDRLAELEQGQADADHLDAEHPDTIASLVDEIADDIPHRRAPQIAAAYLARHARLLAEQITALGQARNWSTWAAEYIHPDREFIDLGKDDDQAAEQPLAFPQLAVPCPRCGVSAGQLCTSHSGTRTRTSDTHQDRTRAYRATQAGR
ncbi:hypothetical protein [Streptomyces cyaneofuscatus]|uniref:zinc finger domain-containing protein n=1 Tax=Streptomyces cyaneofuscatus TaxID=66883 RepID=UPI003666F2DF